MKTPAIRKFMMRRPVKRLSKRSTKRSPWHLSSQVWARHPMLSNPSKRALSINQKSWKSPRRRQAPRSLLDLAARAKLAWSLKAVDRRNRTALSWLQSKVERLTARPIKSLASRSKEPNQRKSRSSSKKPRLSLKSFPRLRWSTKRHILSPMRLQPAQERSTASTCHKKSHLRRCTDKISRKLKPEVPQATWSLSRKTQMLPLASVFHLRDCNNLHRS